MKPIAYTAHAEENLVARSIRREDVEQAVREADQLEESPPSRKVASKRYMDHLLGQEMLLRVITEEQAGCILVITLYKTSKIGKYLNRITP
jgi:Domain of unknown function (DUF4258)